MRFFHSSRRGAWALAITAAVLVAVVLLNIGASALFGGRLLFWDLTNESMYRLNDATVNLMKQTVTEAKELHKDGEQDEKVTILFCADPDLLVQNEQMRYVYYTARTLAKKFPSFIDLKTVDVWSNPSSVDPYRINSYSSICTWKPAPLTVFKSAVCEPSSANAPPWLVTTQQIGASTRVMARMVLTKVFSPLYAQGVSELVSE